MRQIGRFLGGKTLARLAIVMPLAAIIGVQFAQQNTPKIEDVSPGPNAKPSPFNYTTQWGRVLALSGSGKTVYAASERAGVWRSDDSGVTWFQLTRPQPPEGVSASGSLGSPLVLDVAASPVAPYVVLAAVEDYQTAAGAGTGIYRSTDGGKSWTLVHQVKPPRKVTQIRFAPDDAVLVYAAVGNGVAVNTNAGDGKWESHEFSLENHGVWHVAIGPKEPDGKRRVYACGDGMVWRSSGGEFKRDYGFPEGLPALCEPTTAGNGTAAQVLEVEPGHPDHLYLAYRHGANGPRYFAHAGPNNSIYLTEMDGVECNTMATLTAAHKAALGLDMMLVGCGEGSVWLGDYSGFQEGAATPAAIWKKMPGPPVYWGGSTPSGRVYLKAHATEVGAGRQITVGWNADGRMELFYIGPGNRIYHKWQAALNDIFLFEAELGGSLGKRIAFGRNADGRMEVFYIGPNDHIYRRAQSAPNAPFQNEFGLGGTAAKAITVGWNDDGRMELIYIGSDDRIYHRAQGVINGPFQAEYALDGTPARQLAVARNVDRRMFLFYLGTDDRIYYRSQGVPNGPFHAENALGGSPAKQIAVGQNADGRLEVFFIAPAGGIWHRFQTEVNGPFGGEFSLSTSPAQQIAVGKNADGRMELFYLGEDHRIYHKFQGVVNGPFQGEFVLGGAMAKEIALGVNGDGRLEIFYAAMDDRLYHARQGVPSGPFHDVAPLSDYALFFGDRTHVHMALGRPTEGGWRRLDGLNISETWWKANKDQTGGFANTLIMHMDPHAVWPSPDFAVALKKPPEEIPPKYAKNLVLDRVLKGRLLFGNDGGIYGSDDGGKTWPVVAEGPRALYAVNLAGVALPGKGPALFFGTGDNDDFFSMDGGKQWLDPVGYCGDCDRWYANAGQPSRVVELGAKNRKGEFIIYYTAGPGALPNAGDAAQQKTYPYPPGSIFDLNEGSRLLVQSLAGELPPADGDVYMIQQQPGGTRRLLRARNTISGSDPFPQVAVLPAGDINRVQASGGHNSTVFYVGNGVGLWRSKNTADSVTGWDPVVPGGPASGPAKKAIRFFVNPYDPANVYIVDDDGIKHTNDTGGPWILDSGLTAYLTANGTLQTACWDSVCALNDLVVDRSNPKRRFALGMMGVFYTTDGVKWSRLMDARALPTVPRSGFWDNISNPQDPALYVACEGRGILKIHPIP